MTDITNLLGKVHNCDCLEFMKQLPDNCVDLVVTSPPYNMGQFSRNGGKNTYEDYNGNDMDEEDYRHWIFCILDESKRISRGHYAFNLKYRYFNNYCILPHWLLEKRLNVSHQLRNEIIWQYSGFTDVNNSKFYPGHETVFVFSSNEKIGYFNPDMAKLGDVWSIPQAIHTDGISGKIHPAPYPSTLPQRIIEATCDKDMIVFDPFMGSGTTGLAAQRLGRKWFGCELEPKYCAIAEKRIEAERAQLKLF